MLNRMKPILAGALIATAASFSVAQVANAKTFYWISHGTPADPVVG